MSKPIKLDWDQLEEAFNDQNDELVYYLDVVTGHVHLDGEDEDLTDEEAFDTRPPAPGKPGHTAAPMRHYVEPPSTALKIRWLTAFIAAGDLEPAVVLSLQEAMVCDEPGPAIRDVLMEYPDVRDAWYVFRSDRVRELIAAWLAKGGITPADPPPWK